MNFDGVIDRARNHHVNVDLPLTSPLNICFMKEKSKHCTKSNWHSDNKRETTEIKILAELHKLGIFACRRRTEWNNDHPWGFWQNNCIIHKMCSAIDFKRCWKRFHYKFQYRRNVSLTENLNFSINRLTLVKEKEKFLQESTIERSKS